MDDYSCFLCFRSIIGDYDAFESPFGEKKVVYSDWSASGRGLSFIEVVVLMHFKLGAEQNTTRSLIIVYQAGSF